MKIRNSSLMILFFNYSNQRGYKLVGALVSSHKKEAKERDCVIFVGGLEIVVEELKIFFYYIGNVANMVGARDRVTP
jgi:hypothetical protein